MQSAVTYRIILQRPEDGDGLRVRRHSRSLLLLGAIPAGVEGSNVCCLQKVKETRWVNRFIPMSHRSVSKHTITPNCV